MRLRTIFLVVLGLLILWFLYLERAILAPFIVGALFAYIFNPVVSLISEKIKVPRTLSVIVIYLLILGILVSGGLEIGRRSVNESSELAEFVKTVAREGQEQVQNLPPYFEPVASEAILSIRQSRFFEPAFIFTLFPQAISGIIGFIIFLFASFFFLKEGRSIVDKFLNFLPSEYRIETEILLKKMNKVLGGYLRGQLLLILFVSTVYYIGLTTLGVKFALVLAIFSGIADIIPIIGPIASATLVSAVAFLGGTSLGSDLIYTAGPVILLYFVTNQIQEYLMKPFVFGRITKLHPLIILFAVLAGGKIAGILGVILAIPIAGIVRILLEFSLDIISVSERKRS